MKSNRPASEQKVPFAVFNRTVYLGEEMLALRDRNTDLEGEVINGNKIIIAGTFRGFKTMIQLVGKRLGWVDHDKYVYNELPPVSEIVYTGSIRE